MIASTSQGLGALSNRLLEPGPPHFGVGAVSAHSGRGSPSAARSTSGGPKAARHSLDRSTSRSSQAALVQAEVAWASAPGESRFQRPPLPRHLTKSHT